MLFNEGRTRLKSLVFCIYVDKQGQNLQTLLKPDSSANIYQMMLKVKFNGEKRLHTARGMQVPQHTDDTHTELLEQAQGTDLCIRILSRTTERCLVGCRAFLCYKQL